MKRLVRALALATAVLLLLSSPAVAVVPTGTYSWWDMPGGPHYNLDSHIFVSNEVDRSKNPAWFMAHQFAPANGSPGGYVGIQIDNNTGWTSVPNTGKRAIFSWWGASGATCSSVPGAICRPFSGEGEGYQTMIPYEWETGRDYRVRVWVLGTNPDGTETWGAWIQDGSTGVDTPIGYIRVPQTFGWLDSGVNWNEWYAGHRPTCADIPYLGAFYHKLRGNNSTTNASYPPNNIYGSSQACPSDITNWGDPWVLQRGPI